MHEALSPLSERVKILSHSSIVYQEQDQDPLYLLINLRMDIYLGDWYIFHVSYFSSQMHISGATLDICGSQYEFTGSFMFSQRHSGEVVVYLVKQYPGT